MNEELQYNEPWILQRADPYVIKHADGYYYFTATVPTYDKIIMRKSKTLAGLKAATEHTIWTKHEDGIMGSHIWAPELHYLNNKWYLYFAAGETKEVWKIRPFVLECSDSNPITGSWKELGKIQSIENDPYSFESFSLDATVFEHNEEPYLVWAEKEDQNSNLYIAKLQAPNQLSTERVLISTPDYEWEKVGYSVNEGPFVIKKENKIFLTFSASSTGASYCIGMLEADMDSDLLEPKAWTKYTEPVLQSDASKGIYGPGHNCFTTDEKGSDIMVYHARTTDKIVGDPLKDPNRHTMFMKMEWDEQNKPIFKF